MVTPGSDSSAEILHRCWTEWADRLAALEPGQWEAPTRCGTWTVHALAVHAAPDPDLLGSLPGATLAGEAAVADAARLLRGFNQPGGVAEAMADQVASAATAATGTMAPEQVVDAFRRSAAIVASPALRPEEVVPHPVVGSVTVSVLTDVAVMEATVHLLDLVAAVGGEPPAPDALAHTSALLARVADPVRFIEAAAGRAEPASVLPVIR